jgi:hypothetical protein
MQMKHGRLVVVEARRVSVVCDEVGQEEVPVAPCRSQLADCPFLKRLWLEMSSELDRWLGNDHIRQILTEGECSVQLTATLK